MNNPNNTSTALSSTVAPAAENLFRSGTYFLLPERVSEVKRQLKKLATFSAKVGIPAPIVHWCGEVEKLIRRYPDKKSDLCNTFLATREKVEITWPACEVKFGGWTVIAVKAYDEAGALTVSKVTNKEVSSFEKFFVDGFGCEHCNKIRSRHSVAYLQHDDGAIKRVGKSCLEQFTGIKDAAAICALSEENVIVDDSSEYCGDELGGFGPSNKGLFRLDTVLAIAHDEVSENGFVSRAMVAEFKATLTTSDIVNHKLTKLVNNEPKLKDNDASYKYAEEALAWVKGIEPRNDYERNLKNVCAGTHVTIRNLGIAVSLVSAYNRFLSINAEKSISATKPSEYQGTIGKRQTFYFLTLTKVISCENQYGVSHLHIFKDQNGNQFKWFSSSVRLDEGKTYTVTGSVKGHEEYKGVKGTSLTRCKADLVLE
jgi:hypothetical protein